MALERLEAHVGLGVSPNILASPLWSLAPVALDGRHSAALRGLQVVVVTIVAMRTALVGAQKLSMALPVSLFARSEESFSCVVRLLDLRQRRHGAIKEQRP